MAGPVTLACITFLSSLLFAERATNDGSSLVVTSDYLPLDLGNRWIYSRTDSRFKKTDSVRVEIISRPIIRWKTYYVFNRFPFLPGLENANNILIRYDGESRQYLRLTEEGEAPLFAVGGDTDAKFDVSVNEDTTSVANRMSYLTCLSCTDAGMEVVFDKGVGIVGVEVTFDWGRESFELRSAEIGGESYGEPIKKETKGPQQRKGGPIISRADPVLSLEVEKKESGAKLTFKIKNPTESLLSLNFTSAQTYDFVIREKVSGLQIWRWSKGSFFSQVLRNVGLLAEQEWKYEEMWDYKDNERDDIRPGAYEAVAILTTKEPRESAPVEMTIP